LPEKKRVKRTFATLEFANRNGERIRCALSDASLNGDSVVGFFIFLI
jgi:hypothetical protein